MVPVAAKSIASESNEDSSSSECETVMKSKKTSLKIKQKKLNTQKTADEPKKVSESGIRSNKESDDNDSDSGASGSSSNSGYRSSSARCTRRGSHRLDESSSKYPMNKRESFLQDGHCFKVAPRLAKCRECHWSPAQQHKDMPNILCRFHAFRRLKYAKNGQLAIAGFCDPYKDAEQDDKKLWLSTSQGAAELDIEMSCFLLRAIGDQFCDLLHQEKEVELRVSADKTIAWKRVVQGVREICDVCETTLFNFHWTCRTCGFVVCLDCYKSRTSGEAGNGNATNGTDNSSPNGERDNFGWLKCTSGCGHQARRLLLTQIAAGGALEAVASRAHAARALFALPPCTCGVQASVSAKDIAIAEKLLQQALQKNRNMKIEEMKEENKNGTSTVKSESSITSAAIRLAETTEDKSDSSSSDSDDATEFSTLRNFLVRPSPNGDAQPKKKQKKNEDDMIGDILSSVVDNEKDKDGDKRLSLSYLVKQRYERGESREKLPVRIMTMAESKQLYPNVPHSWLCEGRLLHLTDPNNVNNYKPFQDQWERGQPVIVSDLLTMLDKDLWSPASFSRDFGDVCVDLVNCASGLTVPNTPGRNFWDGFELASKRLRDDLGAPMVLKIKDWPPGEDFAELMPARFQDLMKALPLAEYTSRSGKLNLAARLPECFVRPDLGPKMYTAYGGAGGTTNIHLDVSDAVNVMVHASAPSDASERAREAARAAEDKASGVDVVSRQRSRVRPAGALWHIYSARDADKIRDMLVHAEIERGARPRAQHDPVHDQTWYLDAALRKLLYLEYGVEGCAILQCPGDAVFVPAGAPHQVRNLLDCIKVAEDFVSPENVSHCFELAHQFRRLSRQHANKEDKLQIKNVVYHAVKDSLCCLEGALAAVRSDAIKESTD